jgi:outer membrane lipoprotein-sorting protein
MKYYLLPLLGLLVTSLASAQTKIKDGTVVGSSAQPQANSILELESTNKGLLLPRLQLISTTNFSPLTAHVAGMTVYNTNTSGSGVTAVSPGFYYNDGTKWVRVLNNFTETVTTLLDNGNSFTYINELGDSVTVDLLAGPTGPAGPQGPAGVVGVEGQPGQSGTPGTPGQPGGPGAGITIVTNDSGTWVYNPTTNTWTNINGPAGPQGPAGVVGVEGQPGQSGTPGQPGQPGGPGAGITIVTNDSGTWVYNPTTNTWTNINGPAGPQGPAGNDGLTGPAGPQGPAGVVGVEGQPGQSGTPGTPGQPGGPGAGITIVTNDSGTWVYNPTTNTWTNINGPAGPQGPAGNDGIAGPIGPAGPQGPAGVVGVEGQPGQSGTPGTPGQPGGPGAGITIVTNDSGTWVYNPTTNTWTNINGLAGPQGPAGVVGVEGQPGQSGTPGTPGQPGGPGAGITIVTNDSGTWVYNPTTNTWTNINGPAGPQGPAGVVGVEGQPGQSGTPGTPGQPGGPGAGITIVTNDSGMWVYNPTTNTWTNINGPAGPQGPAGNDGIAGPIGPAGPQGIAGNDGATGPAGPIGPAGPQGIAGNDGATGPIGPAGPQGIAGNDGATGPIGPAGPQGIQGNDGPIGPAGPQGIAGNDGATGPAGPQGIQGNDGPLGPQGIAGNDGATGAQGPAGPIGPAGAQGPIGPAGPQGATGAFVATVDNGLNFSTPTNIQLGGALITPTTITAGATNTLAIAGLQTGTTTDQIVVVDGAGVLRKVTPTIADVRRIGTNHISEDAGVGSNGSAMPGSNNVAIGPGAMNAVSIGTHPLGFLGNIAIGGGNQLAKITSPGNVAIGYANLPNATTGTNLAIGPLNLTNATTADANQAVGAQNLNALTTGGSNIAMGVNNLNALTTGGNNQVFGFNSLNSITTQEQNIAIGSLVLPTAVGIKNIGVGSSTLTNLGAGQDNVGLGVASGGALTTGSYNTFFGTEAGNRLIGAATERYTSGSNSLFLGSQTKAQNAVSNQLNIQNYIYGVNGSLAFGDFTGANPLIVPTARLDVTAGNVRVRGISALAGDVATDKVVVADGTGVLKTVTVASLANPSVNIYNADGTVISNRVATLNDKELTFLGEFQKTTLSRYVGLIQEGLVSSPYNQGSMKIIAPDKNGNGSNGSLSIQTFSEGDAQIFANEDVTSLALSTHATLAPAPITFGTSAGGGALGTEKMRITGTGNVGIATPSPSEKFDVGAGNVRIRDIFASAGSVATDRVVVADASGVLKTAAIADINTNLYTNDGTLAANRTVTTNNNFLRFTGNGNTVSINNTGTQGRLVAIGSIRGSLGITGGSGASASTLELYTDASNIAQINASGTGSTGLSIGTTVATPMTFKTNGAHRMSLKTTGEVVINGNGVIPAAIVTANNPKLYVDGNIYSAGTIYTATNTYPDYVFEDYYNGFSKIYKEYKFKTLKEVAEFIKTNKHLPGVTPISKLNVGENGYEIDLTQLSVQQLEKLEELYLYTIEQQEKIEQQQSEIDEMKARLDRLEKLLLNSK